MTEHIVDGVTPAASQPNGSASPSLAPADDHLGRRPAARWLFRAWSAASRRPGDRRGARRTA
jgi:hypothetical protein